METNLEWLLPCVSSLVSFLGGVISEEFPAVLTGVSLHAGVHLLVMSPLDPLVKSLAADGAGLQLELNLVSVEVLDQVYGNRVSLHLDSLRAEFTSSLSVILGEALKMLPHLLPPLLPDLRRRVLDDHPSLRINNRLLLQLYFVRSLYCGAFSGDSLEDDGMGDLEMFDHG